MLDALKKAMGAKSELKLTVDTTAIQAELDSLRAEFAEYQADANGLLEVAQRDNEQLATALAATQEKLDAALADLEQLRAAAMSAEDAAAKAAAEAAALRTATRLEKLTEAVGTEQAPNLLAAFNDLDDARFDAVLSALQGKAAAEAKSDLFNELGATGDVDASKVPTESKEMQMIRAKYHSNKQS